MNSPEPPDGLVVSDLENSDRPLRKAVGTLAIVKASQSLTLIARKVYNVLVWTAQQDPSARQWSLQISQVARKIEYGSRNYELLKKACRTLSSTLVEWESPARDEVAKWSLAPMLAGVDLITHKGSVLIVWSFGHNIQRELLDPSRFAQIPLSINAKLRTVAALELYQICARYKHNPSHLTSRRPWQWWYDALRLQPGKAAAKEPQFKFFKRDTLVPALAEINAVTDLVVELVPPTKIGKFVQDLQFKVHVKPDAVAEEPPGLSDLACAEAIARAGMLGIREREAERLLETFGEAEFERGLELLENRKGQVELTRVSSPSKWLEGVLAKAAPTTAVTEPGAIAASAPRATSHAARGALLRFREQRIAEVWATYLALDYEIKEVHKGEFEEALQQSNPAYLTDFRKHGAAGRLAGPMFKQFLCERLLGADWHEPPAEASAVVTTEQAH
jgi:Initiator Replication protein